MPIHTNDFSSVVESLVAASLARKLGGVGGALNRFELLLLEPLDILGLLFGVILGLILGLFSAESTRFTISATGEHLVSSTVSGIGSGGKGGLSGES